MLKTAVHAAAERGKCAALMALVETGADPNDRDMVSRLKTENRLKTTLKFG